MVIDDVEDDLDAGLVERLDHPLEFLHLLAMLAGGRILVVRGQIPNRVVAPVVAETPADQATVLDELVNGHELHGRYTEFQEVLDGRGMAEPGVGAA